MDVLLTSFDEGVLTLIMNRPARLNALSPELMEALHQSIDSAWRDRAVGAVVLTGAGDAFCAGGDVKAMAEGAGHEEPFDDRVAALRRRMEVARLLHEMPKPTIAMLRGPAAGAGLSLALACDLRIAGDSARLTTAFAKVGLSGDFGVSYFLTRLVGTARARELLLTSPMIGAADALKLGLVTRLVPDAELEAATKALALSLAKGPRVALGYMKQNLNLAAEGSLAQLLEAESYRQILGMLTADHREAARAFVEKRPPVFKGK
jgi:2-(1,2-epoxy-1,2-dihydrophenyl)acetyl-CoA isomerase